MLKRLSAAYSCVSVSKVLFKYETLVHMGMFSGVYKLVILPARFKLNHIKWILII